MFFCSPVREANRGSTSLILQDLAQVDTGLQSSQDTSRSGPDQREGTGSLESSVPSWSKWDMVMPFRRPLEGRNTLHGTAVRMFYLIRFVYKQRLSCS